MYERCPLTFGAGACGFVDRKPRPSSDKEPRAGASPKQKTKIVRHIYAYIYNMYVYVCMSAVH